MSDLIICGSPTLKFAAVSSICSLPVVQQFELHYRQEVGLWSGKIRGCVLQHVAVSCRLCTSVMQCVAVCVVVSCSVVQGVAV